MDLEKYRFYEDFYEFESLNTGKGDELVEEKEPLVTYNITGDELRIYDNRSFGRRRLFNRWRSHDPEIIVGMDVDIGEETREMYLGGDLDAWDDLDKDLMKFIDDSEITKVIQRAMD